MATKPNIALSRWADQIGANLVAPTSGERDLGFQAGTAAASGKVNTELHELYLWALYMNDGALSGTHEIDGDLSVGGTVAFAPKTYTATNATDTLNTINHGLATGAGPVRVANTSGAPPTGLAVATDYWVISTGTGSLKLAASLALAIAGTAINITTDGTGTNTLISTSSTKTARDLAVSRSLTVASDVTINGDVCHGDRVETITGLDFVSASNANVAYTAGRVLSSGGAATFYARLPLKAGDRLKQIVCRLGGDGAVDSSVFELRLQNVAGGGGVIGSATPPTNIAGADYTITVTSPAVLGVGEAIHVSIGFNAALGAIDNVRYTFDHPRP